MSATPAIPQPQTVAIAYIPVLHRGYRQFLESEKIDRLLLLNRESIPETIEYLKKDVRALSIEHVKTAIESWNLVDSVAVATFATLQELGKQSLGMQTSPSSPMNPALRIIMPDDDISEAVIAAYFPDSMIAHQPRPITLLPVFLRWDKKMLLQSKQSKLNNQLLLMRRSCDYSLKHIPPLASRPTGGDMSDASLPETANLL